MVIPREKIKFVFFDKHSVNTIPTLATFVRVLGHCDAGFEAYVNSWYLRNLDYKALYCGSLTDINAMLDTKKFSGTPTTLCFSKLATYPRYKLREYSTIKIKRDVDKADAFVVSQVDLKDEWKNIGPKHSRWVSVLTKHKVYYAASVDLYYIFWDVASEPMPRISNNIPRGIFLQYLKTTAYNELTFAQHFAQECINNNIIPTDSNFLCESNLTALNSDLYDIIEKIENNPNMRILYDTELDAFITSQLQAMTNSDVQTLVGMLSSNDVSIVAMGIKLLATYDVANSVCTTGTILATCWSNIRYNDAAKSVGFKSLLNSLGVEWKDFSVYGSNSKLINKLYAMSKNEADRNNCKAVILKKIEAEILKTFDALKNEYSNFDININLTVS